jgi:hypothetical protein
MSQNRIIISKMRKISYINFNRLIIMVTERVYCEVQTDFPKYNSADWSLT